MVIKYRDKDWLHEQYFTLGKSCPQISKEFGYKSVTINKWFRKYKFKARKNGLNFKGVKPYNYKGIYKDGNYLGRYDHTHPNSDKYGRILEHRYVMSKKIGRPLNAGEIVHHINGDTHDNRPENLEIFENAGVHLRDGHHKVYGREV